MYRKTLDRIYRSIICFFSPLAALSTIEASFKSKSVRFFFRPMGSHQQQRGRVTSGSHQKINEILLPITHHRQMLGVRISKSFPCAKISVADRVNRLRVGTRSAALWPAYLLHLVAHFSKISTSTNPNDQTTTQTPSPPITSTNSQPSWISSRKFLS